MNQKKLKKFGFEPYSVFKKRALKNQKVKKAYDNLEFEFKIISALIDARAKKKLTQKQLADRIGVAQPALARFESGKIDPGLSFLKKVTSGLGLKLMVK